MSANNRIGMVEANPTTPSQKGELVSFSTSQPWATFCIHVPMLERKFPAQNKRKSRFLSARAMRGNSMTVVSAASVTAPCASPDTASARGSAGSSVRGGSAFAREFVWRFGFKLLKYYYAIFSVRDGDGAEF